MRGMQAPVSGQKLTACRTDCSEVAGAFDRLAAAFIPSGVPAAGGPEGMGRVRVRAAGSIRGAAARHRAGASKTSDHALPASGLLTPPSAS